MIRIASDSLEFDLAHLERQTFGDVALQQELLRLFAQQCTRLMPLIAGSGSEGERADAAHSLKGAARAIGAWPVASLAESLETALRGTPDHVDGLVRDLDKAVTAARAAMTERYGIS